MKKYELTQVLGKNVVMDISQLFKEEVLYVNATKLAKQFGKSRNDMYQFFNSEGYKEYVEAYSNVHENMDVKLMEKREGRYGGTYIHSDILMPVLRYLSPEFAVKCDMYIKHKIQESHDEAISTKATALAYKNIDEWVVLRQEGKAKHRTFTDVIKEFCQYAEKQRGYEYKECPYFKHFQDVINKSLGIKTNKALKNKRDSFHPEKLEKVAVLEEEVTVLILAYMEEGIFYKNIYKNIKSYLQD